MMREENLMQRWYRFFMWPHEYHDDLNCFLFNYGKPFIYHKESRLYKESLDSKRVLEQRKYYSTTTILVIDGVNLE